MKVILLFISLFLSSSFAIEKSSDDPVLEFEKYLRDHFESYKINSRERVTKLGGGWVKEQYSLEGEYSYDVQTTNSLISPYKGICEFTLKRSYTDFHKSKESALLDNKFINSDEKKHRHNYLFQKGKWIVSERKNKGYSKWYDCNEIIQSGENKNTTNIHGCWENKDI